MRVDIGGEEHRFVGDPTPRKIDSLIREQAADAPLRRLLFKGVCVEELRGLYASNGWALALGVDLNFIDPIPPLKGIEGLVERPDPDREELIGPYLLGSWLVPHGIGLWVPERLLRTN